MGQNFKQKEQHLSRTPGWRRVGMLEEQKIHEIWRPESNRESG